MAKFAETSCSQCGRGFGPGDHGYSHCVDHRAAASDIIMTDQFGRQPKPVTITIDGEEPDVAYWLRELMRRAEFKGDVAHRQPTNVGAAFRIYPRAVND